MTNMYPKRKNFEKNRSVNQNKKIIMELRIQTMSLTCSVGTKEQTKPESVSIKKREEK